MDAKARQDCIKEIDLLKVNWILHVHVFSVLTVSVAWKDGGRGYSFISSLRTGVPLPC